MQAAFNEPKYEIEAPDFRCQPCAAEIPCEGHYYSAVCFEAETFRRRNYCTRCWNDKVEGEAFAFWRSRRPPLPAAKAAKVRWNPAVVFQFFCRLGEDRVEPEPESSPAAPPAGSAPGGLAPGLREELRFVLALLLIRKKLLNFVSAVDRDGSEWLKLLGKGDGGQVYWVRNPNLSDQQLENVKVKIGELLEMQFG